ncbi:hypothetical protein M9H77_34398 [Catharanthus roseus]|uniref:Uncharacterized protein n=1 Tax=Catharanthus roseus TaxID=4058 RepID=A0ACB9ZLB8_CATRO|nr:hypothetical protein M9H77_34398 [Catharanthus roseus]
MAENPRELRKYFTPNTYNSPIGNRPLEIEANHFKIKASTIQMLPYFYGLDSENPYKHIDDCLEICSTFKLPNVMKRQILDSHTQSIAKLETQIGQLANAISRRDEDKLPSHPMENPRANYHEQAKAVITLRNGKLIDNKVGEPIKDSELNENETKGIDMDTKIENKVEKEPISSSNSKTLKSSPMTSYKPKVFFLQVLLPLPHLRKDNKMEDILETFKEVKINIPLFDAIK